MVPSLNFMGLQIKMVMIDDKDDDEIERELQEGEDNTTAAGFAKAMYKIRTITKVQSKIM